MLKIKFMLEQNSFIKTKLTPMINIVFQLKAVEGEQGKGTIDFLKKLDYYQKSFITTQKTLTKLNGYLQKIGLSMQDIKDACSTGILKFSNLDTNLFQFK